MSVTREEDRQKNGCPSRGLGIAAAAIGVGVGAALYYFFNKREQHPNSEGSTSDWNCERPHAFHILDSPDNSYETISEHETSDTSVHDSSVGEYGGDFYTNDPHDSDDLTYSDDYYDSDRVMSITSDSESDIDDTNYSDWRRTDLTEEQQMALIRQEQFRERSWSLEECSICFDVMLRNQELTRLPCAHNFHTECILPWLQEKQTCPNCRKAAE